jgi:hypothetical protein
MSAWTRASFGCTVFASFALLLVAAVTPGEASPGEPSLSRLPLVFEPNVGQSGAGVAFLARAPGLSVRLENNAVLFALPPGRALASPGALRLDLVGAAAKPDIVALDPLPGRSNYFIGRQPARWHTDVPQYGRIKYVDIYPGIDLVLYGSGGTLEFDFHVSPHGNPEAIQFRLQGAERVTIDPHGDLVAALGSGSITQRRPRVFAQRGGLSREIQGRYEEHGGLYSFAIGEHAEDEQLVIDPVVIASTYLGGSDFDDAYAMTLDRQGNVYLTGETFSSDFPVEHPYQSHQYWSDVFITKLDASMSRIIYSTYLGTPIQTGQFEAGFGIAVDAAGNAYVTGEAGECGFPTTPGAFQEVCERHVGADVFVTKLSPTGNSLVYSTYIHGDEEGAEFARTLALDAAGRVYVAGSTDVPSFPVTAGAHQAALAGLDDGFVAVLNPTGSALAYSTFLGGTGGEDLEAIALDGQGRVYVAGTTLSANFPTRNAYQASFAGGLTDAFLARLSPNLATLEYSSFLGGTKSDRAQGIAIDPAGYILVSGSTDSPDFPRAHALQVTLRGGLDLFLTKLDPSGASLLYSTYFGGRENEGIFSVSLGVDPEGNAYLAGTTRSTDFPAIHAFQPTYGGGAADAFLAKISADGSAILSSSFLGGADEDLGRAMVVGSSASVYLGGSTESTNFPVLAALQPTSGGGGIDAFLTKVAEGCVPSEAALCLAGDRFQVTATFRTAAGQQGTAHAIELTADTGYFWFFDSANVEVVAKVLDACSFNQRFWVFAAGLTNVEVRLTVTDTWTGNVRSYVNPLNGTFQPEQDTGAFGTCAASPPAGASATTTDPAGARAQRQPSPLAPRAVTACTANATTLCLNGDRFAVTGQYRTAAGAAGAAQGVELTGDTGYLWFFDQSNVEVVLKVLDGCAINGHYWIFVTGLTDVAVDLEVTDTTTGRRWDHANPIRTPFAPRLDTSAIACN